MTDKNKKERVDQTKEGGMELGSRSQHMCEEQREGNGAGGGYDHNTLYTNVIRLKINMHLFYYDTHTHTHIHIPQWSPKNKNDFQLLIY